MKEEKNNENIIINEISQTDNIKELFRYINEKNNQKESNIINNIDIFQQFINNPNILKESSHLISFIEQLITQLKLGNNIIIPFLDLCPILIKEYIDSNLDEENNLEYIEIFKLLKINSFISREYLYPIYEYFTDIFYFVKDIGEKDINFKKFNKVFELWKIFYNFNSDENIKEFNMSSYCFIGGSLTIRSTETFSLIDYNLTIEITLSKNNYLDFNKNLILFLIGDKNKVTFKIKYNQLENLFKNKTVNKIILILSLNNLAIGINENKVSDFENFKVQIDEIKKCKILSNFYGQINNIRIYASLNNKNKKDKNKDKKIIIDEIFEPYLINDKGNLYHKLSETKKFNFSIFIKNHNLVKANYINYLDNNFNLYDYFGGFTPFIPFIPLINGIYHNQKLININIDGLGIKYYLFKIIYNIIYSFLKIIEKYYQNLSNSIKKYVLFVFYLIYQIDHDLLFKEAN